MLLTVYDRYHQQRAVLSPNDNSTQVKEIQSDNVLTLSFTLYEHVSLDVNDYVDFLGERYWLMARYEPKEVSTQEWNYDVKFYGIESLIKRFLVLKTVDGEDEPVFTLTAPPREHVAMIVGCINDGMDNTTDWKVGQVDGTENIVIDYEGKYCDEALKEIAEKVGAEYWAEGQTINVCRCEHGDEVTLAYGKGLLEIEPSTADNAKFYTRLFPIGSNKNIDREKYGFSRLQLPGKEKFVDVNADKYGIIHHYESKAFADIYPRRVGVVSSVRSADVTGEDGTPFKIFYFRDNTLNFDPNKYEIGGLVKRVSFQEGSDLAGLGSEEEGTYYFEVNYNSDTREFEIITIWPYDDDTQLPNDILKPKAGDKYILWNISMPDEYYALAEEEYLTAVQKYNAQHAVDVALYKSPTDHVYIEDNGIELSVGLRVKLESEVYFPEEGYRRSRITKITRKVNLPSQMDLEISDALSTGSLAKLSGDIADVKNYTKTATSGTSLPDIIRSWDNTLPTDNNLFSARRSQKEFLNKNNPDRAKKKIIFDEGIDLGDFVEGEFGGRIDGKGNAELLTAVVRSLLRSSRFVDGFAGEGWQIWRDENGLSNLTLDKITVRQTMTIFELLIQKIRSVGGQIIASSANGKIKSVSIANGEYVIEIEGTNEFVAGDLIRCQTFTGATLKNYWVEVHASIDSYLYVPTASFTADIPEAGDEIVLMGNTSDAERQNAIVLASHGADAPCFVQYSGISRPTLDGAKIVTKFSPYGNLITGKLDIQSGSSGLEFLEEWGSKQEQIDSAGQTAQEASEKIDNLKIGGTNLQFNTDFSRGTMGWKTFNKSLVVTDGVAELNADTNNILYPLKEYAIPVKAGETYVLSADVRSDDITSLNYSYIMTYGASNKAFPGPRVTSEWTRVSVVITLDADYETAAFGFGFSGNGTVYFKNIKLEKGNRATEWSPSPLDIESDVQSAQSAADNAQAAINSMNDDTVFSVVEKKTIRSEWENISGLNNTTHTTTGNGSYKKTTTLADAVGLKYDALTTAYNNLKTRLNAEELYVDTDKTGFVRTTLAELFTTYYNEEIALLDKIASATAQGMIDDIEIGIDNLLAKSNVELNRNEYEIGRYSYADEIPVATKTYTFTCCYTLADDNVGIYAFIDSGYRYIKLLSTVGEQVIEQYTFTGIEASPNAGNKGVMTFYNNPKDSRGGVIHWATLVEGNKAPKKWMPSQKDIQDDIKASYDQAVTDINTAKAEAIDASKDYTDEQKAVINQAINDLDATKANLDDVYSRSQADGKITEAENRAIDAAVESANANASLLDTQVKAYADGIVSEEEARAIADAQAKADAAYDKARILSAAASGNMIYKDAEFNEGTNSIKRYNSSTSVSVTVEHIDMADAPNTSGKAIKVHSMRGAVPGKGGWCFAMLGALGCEYICRFVAKLPARDRIEFGSNATGDTDTRKLLWLTSNLGTGEWTEYIYYVKYGTSGTASSTFYFYLNSGYGDDEVDWYISYATVFQLNTATTLITDLEALNNNLEGLNAYVDGAFKDGIIDETEKSVIQSYINVVNESFADLQSSYNGLYNNAYLSGSPKSNLKTAFDNLTNSKNALLSAINNTTPSNYATLVDNAYIDYNSKVSAFKTAYEEANKQIQDKLKTYSDAAQDSANEANDKIDNLEVGGGNLLRNTGFTGDYLSEQLADDKVLEYATQLYSPPLDHWTYTAGISVVILSDVATSNYGVEFPILASTLSQNTYFNLVSGASYTVSFKAKSSGTGNNISVRVGDVTETVMLSTSWKRYRLTVVASSTNSLFSISGNSFQVCEIQLERGNTATAWQPSYLDNASDRAYWQSLKYLQSAVEESSTIVNGGLLLSSIIGVGEHINKTSNLPDTTGGISGIYNDDNDVAFWAGGNHSQAIYTAGMYDNPAYQPTDTELAQMAKFVVTHGGRAILNDIILRGYVYALGGKFTGTVEATDGVFNGTIYAEDGVFSGLIKKRKVQINDSNVDEYAPIQQSSGHRIIDFEKTGSWVVFNLNNEVTFHLPGFNDGMKITTNDRARQYIGSNFVIYNNSGSNVYISGCRYTSHDKSVTSFGSIPLTPSHCANLICEMRADADGYETVGWDVTIMTTQGLGITPQ